MNKLSTSTVAVALLAAVFAPCAPAARPFIYVANAGEDTVSKIDVTLKAEVARYATWFTSGVNNFTCSNTTTYHYPNCNYPIPHSGGDKSHEGPAPSRIARDSTGSTGYVYVLNRFFSTTDGWTGSVNGPHFPVLLKIAVNPSGTTSSGSAVLPITDTNNNNDIDVSLNEAADNAIVWAKSIGTGTDLTGLGRALAIDKGGFLWVGMYRTQQYWKVDPSNGSTILKVGTPGHTPYGCQIDINGHLWSVDEKNTLAEIDTTAATPYLVGVYTHPDLNYSISIFNDCSSNPPKVKVYLSNRSGNTYIVYDPQAPPASRFKNATSLGVPPLLSFAIAVDKSGNIVSGGNTGQVIKTSPTGTLIWSNSTVTMSDLHGLIMDDNDDVWAVDRYGNQVIRYSGAFGTTTAADKVKVGIEPYTYGNVPPPTCSGTATPTPTPSPTPTPTVIPTATPCAEAKGEARCLPNGGYSYTFTVTNNSGSDMSQILLTPVQGSTFTLTPQLANLPTPLQNGQSTTLTTIIGNAKPGDKVCFFVSLMSDNAPCCTPQVCPTLPRCGVIETATPPPPARQQRPPPPSRRGKRRP